MRRYHYLAALAASALLVSGLAAYAQAPDATATAKPAARQARGERRGQLSLATITPEVMNSIAPLSGDQKTKITAIESKLKSDVAAARQSAGAGGADRTQMRGLVAKANDDVKAVLTPAQASAIEVALPALTMLRASQTLPLNAVPALKLTPDQWKQLSAIAGEVREKARAIPREERRAKMPELYAAAKTKAEAVLTPAQKQTAAKYASASRRKRQAAASGAP